MSYSPVNVIADKSAISSKPQDSKEDENRSVVLELPDADGDATRAVLSAHDISYNVKVRRRCCAEVEMKQILKKITGVFKPGLNAIMGATGSGKTMFLNAIADRLDKRAVDGTMLLNGKPITDNFKSMVGYVVQEEIVMGTLTVRENFAFSAALRLPNSISKSEREERIEKVIKELGLQDCADTKIGTAYLRGVSGGEKKRCNIGMELLISPSILFLDEPTSGLDASTSNTVLMFLKRLSERGRTIIFSIHQPRYSIYSMFDNLMLLSEGQTVFHGNSNEALDFFKEQGFICQEHNNPPDFFLDVINADESTLLQVSTTKPTFSGDKKADRDAIQDMLITGFRESEWNTRLQQEAFEIYTRSEKKDEDITTVKKTIEFAAPFARQFAVLAGRTWKDLRRNPESGLTVIVTSLFLSLIMIGVFWQMEEDPITGFEDRSRLLFIILFVQMFFTTAVMESALKERVVAMHEIVSGFYSLSVYFPVKICVDIVPVRLAALVPSCTIIYFGIGMRPSSEAFFLFLLTLFCILMAVGALCILLVSTFDEIMTCYSIGNLVVMTMLLFSGSFINLKHAADWISWVKYASFFKYGIAALNSNEFKDRSFCMTGSNGTVCKAGNQYLSDINTDYKTSWDFWHNHLIISAFAIVLFSLTYVQMWRRSMNS